MNLFGLFANNRKENVSSDSDTKKTLYVDTYRCPQNHACPSIRVCPVSALKQIGYKAPTVDLEKCIRCGKCAKYCPMRALILK